MTSYGKCRINYTLSEAPGIVTCEVLTNDVPIGAECLKNAVGDVNRVVEPGARTINWDASEIWPGHKFMTPSVKARVTVWPTNAPPDWLAVDLTSADCPVTYYASEAALPWGRISGNPKYKGDVLLMRKIPASHVLSFIGSPETEANHLAGRETRRMCTLTNDFYIGIYPLTFRQFYLLNDGPSSTETRLAPVYNQSYNMLRYHRDNAASTPRPVNFPTTSRTFVGGNSRIRDWRTRTGLELDLPTSAQWEIACRAGTDGPTYAALNLICNPNAGASGYEVGLYQPNSWQLYDMIGNRYEFCLDYFSDNITSEAVTDPLGATSDASFRRVIRGTYHTGTYSTHMRAAFFTASEDTRQEQAYGFRLCITLP
jgi:formylglycine-generating enzyme required for sulfatase activity